MARTIRGLKWARTCQRPGGLPQARPRGAKAAGLRYERSLASALPCPAKHGQWFEFEDSAGRGICQPDLLVNWQGHLLVLEAKYSWCPEGHQQIDGLYLPVVGLALRRPVSGLVVVRRMLGQMPSWARRASSLDEAASLALAGHRVVWHWLGVPVQAQAA